MIPWFTYRETRASSSCVSWIYSAGGRGIRGGGTDGAVPEREGEAAVGVAVKLPRVGPPQLGVEDPRSSASYLAFNMAFS